MVICLLSILSHSFVSETEVISNSKLHKVIRLFNKESDANCGSLVIPAGSEINNWSRNKKWKEVS